MFNPDNTVKYPTEAEACEEELQTFRENDIRIRLESAERGLSPEIFSVMYDLDRTESSIPAKCPD